MQQLIKILLAAICSLSSTLVLAQNIEPYFQIKATQKVPESVLYIQSSNQANLKLLDQKSKSYQLILRDVNPVVTFFTDRPARITGQIGNAVYLLTWSQDGKNGFDKTPPNAVLTGMTKIEGKDKNVSMVMELSHPKLDTKHATITYTAKLLSSSEKSVVLDGSKFDFVNLFIDGGVCTTCIIGG